MQSSPSRKSHARASWAFGAFVVVALVGATPLAARADQDESALRSFFEGSHVVLRVDMPGAADGVDVRPGRTFDSSQYGDRLRRYGIAIRRGDRATVTLVKVKNDVIEFQLDGGGFGVFGDDTSTSVDMPDVQKSNREKDLERLVKDEPDSGRRRNLQKELDDLRNARERENRRIASERALAEDHKRAIVAERRMAGGSRFNLRYAGNVPGNITPKDVMDSLAEYVDFRETRPLPEGPMRPAPPMNEGLPRKGMSRGDAERQLGLPVESSERREGSLRVFTLVFLRGDQRITAEFVEDVLIRYTITPRGPLVSSPPKS